MTCNFSSLIEAPAHSSYLCRNKLILKAILLLVPLIACSYVILAQPRHVTLTGHLEMSTGEQFPYRVEFTELNGTVKGFAFTYREPDDTKATIEGVLDRNSRKLSFRETGIVYSHTVRTKAFMCLVDARLQQSVSGRELTGTATSSEADKTACTPGRIVFDNPDEVRKVFTLEETFDTVITMKKRTHPDPAMAPTKPVHIAEPTVTDKVTANVEKMYDWHTDTVIIDVWDGGDQDGDKITLQFNGSPVLSHYLLVKEKKQLHIPLSGRGTDVISILAENEGFQPPNTASLWLTDGATRYSVLAYDKKGEQAVIKIRRVR